MGEKIENFIIIYILIASSLIFLFSCNKTKFSEGEAEVASIGGEEAKVDENLGKLEISGPEILSNSACSTPFTIKPTPGKGQDSADMQNITVTLSASQTGTNFYSDETCTTEVSTLEISDRENDQQFFVQGEFTEEKLVLIATATGFNKSEKEVEISFPNNGETPPADPATPSKGITIAKVPDQFVNSSDGSPGIEEVLKVKLNIQGGNGSIDLELKSTPEVNNAYIVGTRINWEPGFIDQASGAYDSQEGEYTFTITATDQEGQTGSVSFKVTVRTIKFLVQQSMQSNGDQHTSSFAIHESLHPERKYEPVLELNGTKLVASECVSVDPAGQTISFEEPLLIQSDGVDQLGDTQIHNFVMPVPAVVGGLPYQNSVFITHLRFDPSPDTTISDSEGRAKSIKSVFFITNNCSANSLECNQQAVVENGMSNYFYCSDKYSSSNQEERSEQLKGYYCQHAYMSGLTPDICK